MIDTRQFETEVLGQLINAYNELKQKYYPALSTLTEESMEKWVSIIAEGAIQLPFYALSREMLEAFTRSVVMSLVDARATISTMLTDSSSSE